MFIPRSFYVPARAMLPGNSRGILRWGLVGMVLLLGMVLVAYGGAAPARAQGSAPSTAALPAPATAPASATAPAPVAAPSTARASAPASPALSAARLAAAKKLMQITNSRASFETLFPAFLSPFQEEVEKKNPKKLKQVGEVFKIFASRLVAKRAGLLDRFAALYAQELSADEMGELIAFYSHGVGAKYLAVQPAIDAQTFKIAYEWAAEIANDIVVEVRGELDKRGLKH